MVAFENNFSSSNQLRNQRQRVRAGKVYVMQQKGSGNGLCGRRKPSYSGNITKWMGGSKG